MGLLDDSRIRTREMVRDYLLLVLFTGLRKEEAAQLTWNNVDLKARTLTVIDTKNHLDHTLPLSDFLFELLLRRREGAMNTFLSCWKTTLTIQLPWPE